MCNAKQSLEGKKRKKKKEKTRNIFREQEKDLSHDVGSQLLQ